MLHHNYSRPIESPVQLRPLIPFWYRTGVCSCVRGEVGGGQVRLQWWWWCSWPFRPVCVCPAQKKLLSVNKLTVHPHPVFKCYL